MLEYRTSFRKLLSKEFIQRDSTNIHQITAKLGRVFPSFASFVLVFHNQENGGNKIATGINYFSVILVVV